MKKIILGCLLLFSCSVFASTEVDVDFSKNLVKNQINIGQAVSFTLSDGVWSSEGDKSVWTFEVNTPNAAHMSFSAHVGLPAYGVLKVGNSNLTRTYTPDLVNSDGVINGIPVKGNTLKFEVVVPSSEASSAQFTLDKVFAGAGDSSSSSFGVKAFANTVTYPNENYSCVVDNTTLNSERSTVDILVTQSVSGASGQIQCTGTLVNDVAGDKKHTILTAAHCGTSDNWIGKDVTVLWGRTSSCVGGLQDLNGTTGAMSSGYTTAAVVQKVKVANNANTVNGDMWLLQSSTAPPSGSNPYWAGVDAVPYLTPTEIQDPVPNLPSVYNVSHPTNLTKAYAFSNQQVVFEYPNGPSLNGTPYDGLSAYGVEWTEGADQEGSSGSPLFNPANQLIGTLFGCTNGSNTTTLQVCEFPAMAVHWDGDTTTTGKNSSGWYTTVKEVLDPSNTGTQSYAGLEDSSRSDNLSVFFDADTLTAVAGGKVNLKLFTAEASTCTASSSPSISGWAGSLTVNNGNSVTTPITIPSSSQYTLSVDCLNSKGFSVTQELVINSGAGGSSSGGSSSGGGSSSSSGGSSSSGSSSSGSGGGSGGGGGAISPAFLLGLLGMAALRKKKA